MSPIKRTVVASLSVLLLLPATLWAVWSGVFTATRPLVYADGSLLEPDKPLAYLWFDSKSGALLFSGTNATVSRTNLPDTSVCFYVKAAEYDALKNAVVPGTESDQSPERCVAAPVKKIGMPDFTITRK